ncbi:hypothetical protein [Roseateles chitinivorans]|uniref:hypothetical protein n=1 Tax=Roseateles chitinivorans TaxID=2917965 RepID=UPI003D67AFB5
MQLELHLVPPPRFETRVYRSDLDDARSILIDVCWALESRSEFRLSGFGLPRWPVDAGTDLAILLEQLPHALRQLEAGQIAVIDFYEQGVECRIEWMPEGSEIVATCRGFGRLFLDPVVETMATSEVIEMLSKAWATFIETLTQMAPELLDHPWIVEWRKGIAPL